MPAHSEIDVRMKENYENPYRIKLTKRMPVIVRIDGKAFHTFTSGFEKPFDHLLIKAMQSTMKFLCKNIMGCKLGYTQSDEISLLLTDYDTFDTQPYFDYNIQKIASVCASMATLEFNRVFAKLVQDESDNLCGEYASAEVHIKSIKIHESHKKARDTGAMFDARCFNIPREEVTNYFYSRQLDATRNSIEMFGRSLFSDKELHKKSTNDIQEMAHEKYGLNWNDLAVEKKRGSCCIKSVVTVASVVDAEKQIFKYYLNYGTSNQIEVNAPRTEWVIDHYIPIFKGEDRDYIDKYINLDQLL